MSNQTPQLRSNSNLKSSKSKQGWTKVGFYPEHSEPDILYQNKKQTKVLNVKPSMNPFYTLAQEPAAYPIKSGTPEDYMATILSDKNLTNPNPTLFPITDEFLAQIRHMPLTVLRLYLLFYRYGKMTGATTIKEIVLKYSKSLQHKTIAKTRTWKQRYIDAETIPNKDEVKYIYTLPFSFVVEKLNIPADNVMKIVKELNQTTTGLFLGHHRSRELVKKLAVGEPWPEECQKKYNIKLTMPPVINTIAGEDGVLISPGPNEFIFRVINSWEGTMGKRKQDKLSQQTDSEDYSEDIENSGIDSEGQSEV